METSVDLDDVEHFITSDKFTKFLISNTTDFVTAAYILQSLLDDVKESRKQVSEQENN